MSSATKSKARLEWIDGLRGIAAIMVAILHSWLLLSNNISNFDGNITAKYISLGLSEFFDWGKIGVVVFFLISGYVIPFSLHKTNSVKFIISRFFRLYPAYWFAILCACLIMAVPPLKQLLANITMLQRFIGIEDMVGVFWTLQIELIFYFICLVLYWTKKLSNDKFLVGFYWALLIAGVIMAFLRFKLEMKLPVALPLGLAVMFLGMLWRNHEIEKSDYIDKKMLNKLIATLVAFLLPITLLAYSHNFGFNETWYKYFVSYIVALIMFKLFSYYKPSNKILVYLGTISYSLYLLHPIFGMELPFKIFPVAYYDNHKLVFFAFFWSFSVCAATICYYFIEKPFIRIGKKLSGLTNKQKEVTTI